MSLASLRHPLRALKLESGEGMLFGMLTILIGMLFGGYTVAKVVRDSMFISEFGATSLPWGYVGVALAAIGTVAVESRLTVRLSRAGATAFGQFVAIGCSIAFAALYPANHRVVAGLFYIWAGSQAMMLLSYFWLLALELWDPRRAKTILPLFSGAGLLGGVAGGALAHWGIGRLGMDGLLWVLAGSLVVARGITMLLDRQLPVRPFDSQAGFGTSRLEIFRHSSFLRYLAATLALSVVVSTLVDFQFKYAAQQAYPDAHALTGFLGLFYAGLNALALVAQFGLAGWLVKRSGVYFSTLPQPLAILVFATWVAFSPIFGVIVALRWVQGVLFQTLGKASFELYFMAVRPADRQRIKPALDTIVERVSDAAVGVMLLVVLHSTGVDMRAVAVLTVIAAALWLWMLTRLQRRYVSAFRDSLALHSGEVPISEAGLGLPAARRTLIQALQSEDEPEVVLALSLAPQARHRDVRQAVLADLDRPSAAIRAAAVRALDALRTPGLAARVEPFLAEADADLRRAAIGYLLSQGGDPVARVRAWLDGTDAELRAIALETLLDRTALGPGAVTLDWIDARIGAAVAADRAQAAFALALIPGAEAEPRLRTLLADGDQEVRRAALRSLVRRPAPALLDLILEALRDPALTIEAREAVVALGTPEIPALAALAEGAQGATARRAACEALARIGGRSAIAALLRVVRGNEPDARYDALRALNRLRARSSSGLIKKRQAHRLWQREIEEYREYKRPAHVLEGTKDPRIRLLAASFAESADRALDRACRALACYHRPDPFRSVYQYLRNPASPGPTARALEYLSHLLPRRRFEELRAIIEEKSIERGTEGAPNEEEIRGSIRRAYEIGDAWLKACAVRAAFAVDGAAPFPFAEVASEPPLVEAELAAYHASHPAARGA